MAYTDALVSVAVEMKEGKAEEMREKLNTLIYMFGFAFGEVAEKISVTTEGNKLCIAYALQTLSPLFASPLDPFTDIIAAMQDELKVD
jgi:hypothetical protein